MKITHNKIITDGVETEFLDIQDVPQIGYQCPVPLGKIDLKTAYELVKVLQEKLSELPY